MKVVARPQLGHKGPLCCGGGGGKGGVCCCCEVWNGGEGCCWNLGSVFIAVFTASTQSPF